MRALRLALAGTAFAVALMPATASACQWEIYQDRTEVVPGLVAVEHPNARCVAP